jgi:LmbE family N-acetylglucosaminyl deacetylase
MTPRTTEEIWIQWLRRVPTWLLHDKPTVVVAPHPDDETLSVGGLIALQRLCQIPVTLLAVTDGEAAYPGIADLGRLRRVEQAQAAEALGMEQDSIVYLGLRDSAVAESEEMLTERIQACVNSDCLLVAPWPLDPHPDHEACGRAAATAANRTGATLISYLFWTWHRLSAERLNGLPLRCLNLSAEARSRRAKALACHQSQLHRDEGPPILPEILLAPARRPFETFVIYGD